VLGWFHIGCLGQHLQSLVPTTASGEICEVVFREPGGHLTRQRDADELVDRDALAFRVI
jgi:hypothetical protein